MGRNNVRKEKKTVLGFVTSTQPTTTTARDGARMAVPAAAR
jgi:hypothetical protein